MPVIKDLNITQISTEKIFKPCSTKTFIAKTTNENTKKTIKELQETFQGSYITNFRNCVIKKIGKKSIKLYTNLTMQVSGISDINDMKDILNDLITKPDYSFQCVMSNWTVRISDKIIDLNKTMEVINKCNNKTIAYFLRGYPLIIKYNVNSTIPTTLFTYDNTISSYVNKEGSPTIKNSDVSILMFKSGNCIVSGPTEKSCAEAISSIKNNVVEKEEEE